MKTTCIIWLVAAAFIAMHARADSCVGPSSRAATNEQFSVDGRFDRTEKKWSYVFTNLKTGEQRVGALAPIEAHAHLEFFLGRDGASFAVLDEHAGHRLTDRFLLYSSDGKLIASLGLLDLLTKEEQKDVQESVSHIRWLAFDPKTKSYGTCLPDDNAVKLTTRAGREMLVSLADGTLIKKGK